MALEGAFGVGDLTGGNITGIAEIEISAPIGYSNGGTNATSAAGARHNLLSQGLSNNSIGDIWYRSALNTVTRLQINPTPGYVLTVVADGANRVPGWREPTGGTGPGPGDGSGGIGEVPSTPPGYWVRTIGAWTQTIDDGVY